MIKKKKKDEKICKVKKVNTKALIPEKEAPKKRGRKPGKNKMYFTSKVDNAITRYVKETNINIKNKIYNEEIKHAFEKLAENIINTFSFSYIPQTFKEKQTEVVSHMVLNMDKFDTKLGKAFSYFSIMAKNYLIISNNQGYSESKSNYYISSINNNKDDKSELDILDESHEKTNKGKEVNEFIKLMVEYWESNITLVFKKKRDLDIAYSVIELFKNVHSLEFFNKKALYLLVREMTGYKTQYITRVINKMQNHYSVIKNSYYSTGTIDEDSVVFSK